MYWQYLTSNGFKNYVASANLYFGFVTKYSYFDVWELLMNYCNKWCVMLNHYDLGCSRFGLKSLVISWTTRVIWAEVWEFNLFGGCFWTCALIIWMVPWHAHPYLVHHYQQNMDCSLPRGMPMVVDESVEAGLGRQLDVIPYVLCLWWIVYCDEISGDPRLSPGFVSGSVDWGTPTPPYILWRGRVTKKVP
jgi:hypothetical protein